LTDVANLDLDLARVVFEVDLLSAFDTSTSGASLGESPTRSSFSSPSPCCRRLPGVGWDTNATATALTRLAP